MFYAWGEPGYILLDPPDPRTIRNALKNGISIHHLGRQLDLRDFERFDLILPMDRSNKVNLLRLPSADLYLHKIKLMRVFDSENRGADVPDPYYGIESDFQEVFEILHRSIGDLVKSLEADI